MVTLRITVELPVHMNDGVPLVSIAEDVMELVHLPLAPTGGRPIEQIDAGRGIIPAGDAVAWGWA